MKQLKKTLALVLAVVLLISVVPFSVNAQEADIVFSVAKVNGNPYDGTTPINSGDTVSVDITAKRSADEVVSAFMVGFAEDSEALTFVSFQAAAEWNGRLYPETDYQRAGGTIKIGYSIETLEFVVGTVTYHVNDTFTGNAVIQAGLGTKNYLGIDDGEGTVRPKSIIAEGCSFDVFAPVDKTQLKAQLDAAAALKQSDYIPRTWAVLAAAVTDGQATYDDPYAQQSDVNADTQAIADAIAGLIPTGNKRALQEIVNTANMKIEEGIYTPETVANLEAAVDAAQIVLDDDDALQSEINEQVGLVQAAIDALQLNTVTVRFLNYDGSVFDSQEIEYGGDATVPQGTPVKPADKIYQYSFVGWIGTAYLHVTEPVVDILPDFSESKVVYHITFVDENDELIAVQDYNYDDIIDNAPQAPEKPADETYTYHFAGWSPSLEPVTSDTTYKATYEGEYINYTVQFVNYDGSPIITYDSLHWGDEVIEPDAPTREKDDVYTYEFAGWDTDVVPVAGNAIYTATYTPSPRLYTINFYNGETLYATQTYGWGAEVNLPEDPEKEPDQQNTYTFIGWTPKVVDVAGDANYFAEYQETPIDYEIRFVNYNDEEIISYKLHWGDTVEQPAAPERPSDETYNYVFTGWDPEVDVVKGSVIYKAVFEPVYINYTIEFVDYDGKPIVTYNNMHWGDEVEEPAEPTREATQQYHYEFAGWDKDVVAVAGNATYTATYNEILNTYTVTFLNYNDTIFKTVVYNYGDMPVAPEETPEKPDDETYYYTYVRWEPEFTEVTGDTSYSPIFDKDYLDADYRAVKEAVDEAWKYLPAEDQYTPVSFTRLSNAVGAVDYTLKINEQDKVYAYADAIWNAIDRLVSANAYNDAYDKCAAVNNDNGQYTVESYNAFKAEFEALGEKQNFNTEDATQAQVDEAYAALEAAYELLKATNLQIGGGLDNVGEEGILIDCNTDSNTTSLFADDGGAGTAILVYTDTTGSVIENEKMKIGTGVQVELVQNGQVQQAKIIVVYGDINGDGQVSIADIRMARRMALDQSGFSDYQILAAKCGGEDINVDAVIALAKAV